VHRAAAPDRGAQVQVGESLGAAAGHKKEESPAAAMAAIANAGRKEDPIAANADRVPMSGTPPAFPSPEWNRAGTDLSDQL
jgi:hypothetical protein